MGFDILGLVCAVLQLVNLVLELEKRLSAKRKKSTKRTSKAKQ